MASITTQSTIPSLPDTSQADFSERAEQQQIRMSHPPLTCPFPWAPGVASGRVWPWLKPCSHLLSCCGSSTCEIPALVGKGRWPSSRRAIISQVQKMARRFNLEQGGHGKANRIFQIFIFYSIDYLPLSCQGRYTVGLVYRCSSVYNGGAVVENRQNESFCVSHERIFVGRRSRQDRNLDRPYMQIRRISM